MNAYLWSDDATQVDLLSFDAVVHAIAGALLDELLEPGHTGSVWQLGKRQDDRPSQSRRSLTGGRRPEQG